MTDKSNKLKWVMHCATVSAKVTLRGGRSDTSFALRLRGKPIVRCLLRSLRNLFQVPIKYAGANEVCRCARARPPKKSRLCRPMCGRPLAFRQVPHLNFWAMPSVGAQPRIHCENLDGSAKRFRTSVGTAERR